MKSTLLKVQLVRFSAIIEELSIIVVQRETH